MTKQPPFATKLRLSKLCRGIIALALVKLCVLTALVADIPLPELRWENAETRSQASQPVAETPSPKSTTLVMGTPEHSLLAQRPEAASTPTPAQAQATPQATPDTNATAEPQGSAAALAAARLRPNGGNASVTMPVSTVTKDKADVLPTAQGTATGIKPDPASLTPPAPALAAAVPQAPAATAVPQAAAATAALAAPVAATPTQTAEARLPLLASGVDNPQPAVESPWWQNMLQLKKLPVPHLGTAQVAHAAALDTPPAPTVPQAAGTTPFTPPAQIPKGQDPSGAPLPPRSTTARPLPAGSSGLPVLNPPAATNSVDPLLTAVPPPAPNVNAYTPPEDPNRKQQELARREQEILALKQQMEQRLQELESAEMRVKGMIKDANDIEAKKVSGLIAVYANMKPKQAAQTLQSLDERVAVKILTGLTPKQAGEILSYADPKITAKLTELMTRMQMQP